MNKTFTFSEFSKQSKKGIVVLYLNLLFKFLRVFWIFLFLFIKDFSKFSNITLNYIYLGVLFLLVFFFIRAYMLFKNFQFKIADHHFILKQGILQKTNTSISFDRIQNINFKQNLIQQVLDVYQVNIETAGSSKTEIAIKALSFAKANALKSELASSERVSIEEETVAEKPFLKVKPLALLKVSLTENHFQSLLLVLALGFGVFQQLNEILEGFGKEEVLDNFITENTSAFEANFILFLFFFVLLLLTALISSFIRIFLFHFNLTAFIKNNTIEIYQGLITKKSIVLKKDKVQHITVSHNPIKKQLGIHYITFKQAVSGKINQKKEKLIKIVGCKATQALKIKTLLFDAITVENTSKNWSAPFYKVRMYFRSFLVLIIINGAFYMSVQNFSFLYINIVLVPLFVFLIALKFKKRNYQFNDDLLLINSGTIETHKTYLPFFKVQNIQLKQTFFQTQKNVADLVFQTASGKLKLPCLEKEKALQIYNYTLFKIATSKQSWM